MQKISLSFLILFSFIMQIIGQETNVKENNGGHLVEGIVEEGDTLMHVTYNPITILPPYTLNSKREVNRYSRLVLYVKKVYPYSKIVSEQVNEIHKHLDEYDTKREKSEYIKQKEEELKKEFEGQLRKLTFSQGRILIKLIDRETGVTTYDLVKELKGSLNAFFWQSVARLFGSNLKLEYDPNGEDRMIEDIVVKIENGEL
jgi:hypothetical protein